jgi:hypothetical protein
MFEFTVFLIYSAQKRKQKVRSKHASSGPHCEFL